jgi:hypothetical protein
MSDLCKGAAAFLLDVYSEEDGLFPYSTRLDDRGRFVNDFTNPLAVRYTINSLLGLRRAAKLEDADVSVGRVDEMIDRFLSRQYDNVSSPADWGLLTVLLAERGGPMDKLADGVDRIRRVMAERRSVLSLNLQDLGWMLWGSSVAAREGLVDSAQDADRIFDVVERDFVDRRSGLARHSRRFYRRNLVSFGSTVYFLRSSYEYAALSGSRRARDLYESGVQKMIDIQGPRGEWPWMIAVRTARPIDFYPVFAVHQDSMAMLFLLPALDAGLPRTAEAIESSFRWVLGDNELDLPMLLSEPYFAYRSVERSEPMGRALRYARATLNLARQRDSKLSADGKVHLNPECRSYHLGWILYAWAGRSDVPGAEGERLQAMRPVAA